MIRLRKSEPECEAIIEINMESHSIKSTFVDLNCEIEVMNGLQRHVGIRTEIIELSCSVDLIDSLIAKATSDGFLAE
jgi:hypothetical protein